jgi:hypothetical protein
MRDVVKIDVRCDRGAAGGWICSVTLRDGARATSRHEVTVAADDLARLAPGTSDPARLVEASLHFLLEREPPSAILRTFDLPAIGRYFPEYEREIRHRLGAS